MELNINELNSVEAVALDSQGAALKELRDSELAFVGGGIGDFIPG